eukprot:1642578-Amphidinium_carterae.1
MWDCGGRLAACPLLHGGLRFIGNNRYSRPRHLRLPQTATTMYMHSFHAINQQTVLEVGAV